MNFKVVYNLKELYKELSDFKVLFFSVTKKDESYYRLTINCSKSSLLLQEDVVILYDYNKNLLTVDALSELLIKLT